MLKLREAQGLDIHSGGCSPERMGTAFESCIWKCRIRPCESNRNPFCFSRCYTPCLQLRRKNNRTFRRFLRNHQGSLTNFSNTFQIQSQVTRRLLTEGFRNLTAKTALGKSTTNFSNRDNSDFAESKFRLDLFILQYKQKALTSKIRKESAL